MEREEGEILLTRIVKVKSFIKAPQKKRLKKYFLFKPGWHSNSQDKVGLGSSLLGNKLLAQGKFFLPHAMKILITYDDFL